MTGGTGSIPAVHLIFANVRMERPFLLRNLTGCSWPLPACQTDSNRLWVPKERLRPAVVTPRQG